MDSNYKTKVKKAKGKRSLLFNFDKHRILSHGTLEKSINDSSHAAFNLALTISCSVVCAVPQIEEMLGI
jgi:hypothetical protein